MDRWTYFVCDQVLADGVGEGFLFMELEFAFFLVGDGVVPFAIGIETENKVVFEVK